jgi:hypothetical protein
MDTGAPCNLITERSLEGLKFEMMGSDGHIIVPLLGELSPKGKVVLRWRFMGESNIYEDEFYVLPDSVRPDFDCLLGRDWMNRNGYELKKT